MYRAEVGYDFFCLCKWSSCEFNSVPAEKISYPVDRTSDHAEKSWLSSLHCHQGGAQKAHQLRLSLCFEKHFAGRVLKPEVLAVWIA